MELANKSVCARCRAALGRTCCEAGPGEALATLTLADVERVAAATGRAPASFVDEEWLSLEEARAYEERRPLYAGYFRHGPRRLTLKLARGACVLLSPSSGCSLLGEARPTACLLYPLEPWPDGSVSVIAGRSEAAEPGEPCCLAIDEAEGLDELRAALRIEPGELARLCDRLRDNVRDHARRSAAVRRVP